MVCLRVHAQSAEGSSGSPWLIKWKGGEISVSEFEDAYQRMNGKPAYSTTLDSLKDFLGVYADYRLKLEEAKKDGLDDDPSVQKEIVGPFILDKEVTDPAVRELYDRRKWDVHAAHFLASVKNWKNPADTLAAYKRAMQVIQMLDAGYPFTFVCMSPTDRAVMFQHDLAMLHGKKLDTLSDGELGRFG